MELHRWLRSFRTMNVTRLSRRTTRCPAVTSIYTFDMLDAVAIVFLYRAVEGLGAHCTIGRHIGVVVSCEGGRAVVWLLVLVVLPFLVSSGRWPH